MIPHLLAFMECFVPIFLLAWDVRICFSSPTGFQSSRGQGTHLLPHLPLDTPQRLGLAPLAHLYAPSPTVGCWPNGHPHSLPPCLWNPAPLTRGENANDSFPSLAGNSSMNLRRGLVTETQGDAYQGASGKISPPISILPFPFCSLMSSCEDVCLQLG